MKAFLTLVFLSCIVMLGFQGCAEIKANYRYQNEILSYWELADRASTIAQKSDYVDKFVAALEKTNLEGHNAIVFPTPQNSLRANFEALQSLQSRLHEIKTMDPKSFEYQTAIQQITQQEQGEAHAMLDNLYGGWLLHNGYWYCWQWISLLIVAGWIIIGFSAFLVLVALITT